MYQYKYQKYKAKYLTLRNVQTGGDEYGRMPDEIIYIIGLDLSYKEIINTCSTSRRFNKVVCDNEKFWMLKTQRDYPNQQKIGYSWKQTYLEMLGR